MTKKIASKKTDKTRYIILYESDYTYGYSGKEIIDRVKSEGMDDIAAIITLNNVKNGTVKGITNAQMRLMISEDAAKKKKEVKLETRIKKHVDKIFAKPIKKVEKKKIGSNSKKRK